MQCKLMGLTTVQIARVLLLVKRVRPVRLSDRTSAWGLLIQGRGFNRFLRDEPLPGPMVYQNVSSRLPRPLMFDCSERAVRYAQGMGLMPARTRWGVAEGHRDSN